MNAALRPAHTAPRPPLGEHEITIAPDWSNDEPVVCHYELLGSDINLISAYIRGWDCYRVLSREQLDEVEQLIREHT